MKSQQGDTFQSVSLSKGLIKKTTGTFKGVTTFVCHVAGDLTFTFEGGTSETHAWAESDSFPVKATSITVASGTFSFGVD